MIKQKVRCELVVDRTREYRIFMTNTNLMDFVQFVLMLIHRIVYMLFFFWIFVGVISKMNWCHCDTSEIPTFESVNQWRWCNYLTVMYYVNSTLLIYANEKNIFKYLAKCRALKARIECGNRWLFIKQSKWHSPKWLYFRW